jgi:two-component system LytT family response regulator
MTACIIDDEFHSRQSLADLLSEFCPEVTVIGTSENALDGKKMVEDKKPDILFLDIQMPGKTGLALMDDLDLNFMSVVFTTAYSQFVLPALRTGAVDYLEKPIAIEELIDAVKRVTTKHQVNIQAQSQKLSLKLVVPLQDSTRIIKIKDIIYFESSDGYTFIYIKGNQKLLSSRNLKWFEDKVDPSHFFRTHKSYLINWKYHVKEILKHGGCSIQMSNKSEIPVSRRKLVELNMRLALWT